MGNSKNGKGSHNKKHRNSSNEKQSSVEEARKLKQQAERKSNGPERIPILERCCHLFQTALNLPLSSLEKQQQEILFDLGEAYMLLANAVRKVSSIQALNAFRANAKKVTAIQMKVEALRRVDEFCKQSAEAYRRAFCIEDGDLRKEAAINCANVLCDRGEILCDAPDSRGGGFRPAAELFAEAHDMYSRAVAMDPEDVELLGNLADCCVKRAENVLSIAGSGDSARDFYTQGFSGYMEACNRADFSLGDDIAGLLQNWGAGLMSFAKNCVDVAEGMEAFKQAEAKLRNAAELCLTDASIRIALGELFSEQADWHSRVTADQGQFLMLLEKSSKEGYGAALKIDGANLDALVGMGEVCLTLSKHYLHVGDRDRARENSLSSLQWYTRAAKILEEDSDNRYEISFEDNCDLIYNLACAAALSGQQDISYRSFSRLTQMDAIIPDDLERDPDMESLKHEDWFILLTQRCM